MSPIKRVKTPLLLSYFLVFISLPATAQTFSERSDWGPTNYALGGTTATAFPHTSGFLTNPATLGSFSGSSAFGADYQLLPRDLSSWSISVIDGTNGIVGGAQFHWVDEQRARRQTYSGGLAYRSNWIWLGTSANIYNYSKLSPGSGWHFSGGAGFLIPVPGGLTFGAYGKNFLDREKDTYLPPTFGGGATYVVPQVARISIETSKRFSIPGQGWNVSSGMEYLMKDYFSLRGGYHWNRSHEDSFWSAGAALAAPKINLAFTFSQTTKRIAQGYSFEAFIKF